MRKKVYWAILLVISLAGLVYYFTTAATVVEVAAVGTGDILHTVVDTGYVQANDKTDIFATQNGRIISLPVSVGQNVEKNQLLMVLQNQDLSMSSKQIQVQISQANAAASAAQAALQQGSLDLVDFQAQFDRAQELFAAGAISQVEYDAAKSQLEKTQASIAAEGNSLQAAQQQVYNYQGLLNNSRLKEQELQVRSPISGTLMQVPVQQEAVVMYGALLAEVASVSELEIKADLLSDDLGEVKLGQKVQITAPVLGDQVLVGEVAKIYPQAEEKQSALGVIQRRVPTIIRMENTGNLKPGYETRVSIITASKSEVLIVPRQAVLKAANGQKQVMVIVNNRIQYLEVATGLQDSTNVEITAGLKSGDQIVKDASVLLPANARVKAKHV
ncbi:MAG: efflux RND transporter periplasmic adaptor subunit [Firmicutes bacterium]|nr:efflux RND transporter periplasmic adaptor subunit [Bacillota bacterium]